MMNCQITSWSWWPMTGTRSVYIMVMVANDRNKVRLHHGHGGQWQEQGQIISWSWWPMTGTRWDYIMVMVAIDRNKVRLYHGHDGQWPEQGQITSWSWWLMMGTRSDDLMVMVANDRYKVRLHHGHGGQWQEQGQFISYSLALSIILAIHMCPIYKYLSMFYHTFLLGREVSLLCSYWSTRFLYFFHQKVPTKYNPLMFSGANGRRPWLVSQREHQRLHNMAPQCSRQTQVFVSIYICICRYMYTYI